MGGKSSFFKGRNFSSIVEASLYWQTILKLFLNLLFQAIKLDEDLPLGLGG